MALPREHSYDRHTYERLLDETRRMTRIVEHLFALAGADSGLAIPLEPLDIQELVGEVGARFTSQTQPHGVHLRLDLDEVPLVDGNSSWLTQLILNLLENALDHTPADGEIALLLDSDANAVTITVRDTGEGIAEDQLDHIFERFYRVDRSRNRASGGAGLGLAICQWIAISHNGHLEVRSELGKGTSVTLHLPPSSSPQPAGIATLPEPAPA
jgi:signal transduction histidine kinase